MRRALRDAVMAGRADEGLSNAGPAARIESALRLLGAATPADEATTAAENAAASPQGGRAASAAAARSALPPPPPALGAPHRVTSVTVETHEGSWSSPCWAAPAPAPVSAGASPVACRSSAGSPPSSAGRRWWLADATASARGLSSRLQCGRRRALQRQLAVRRPLGRRSCQLPRRTRGLPERGGRVTARSRLRVAPAHADASPAG